MHNKTVKQLSASLKNKEFSSVELVTHYLDRINKFNPELNCYITTTESIALEQAKQADQILGTDQATPLTGIPIAHKDIFCTKGVRTSCGSKMLDNFIAPYDATVIQKLFAENTVMLGKTNMDEFAMGSSNENSYYGPVKNPWDLTAVPGGSSGGSAAAIAAGLAPAATGTDTGGSIRQPAAFTGICGLKPTYGCVSRYGMVAFASSLDQGGPMAQDAEDTALLLNAMTGFDEKDSTSVDHPKSDYTSELNNSLAGLKIGIPKEFFDQRLNPELAQTIEHALQEYQKLGATLVDISLPHIDLSIAAYYVIAPAECSSNLSRFDGVRYGYRCQEPKNLQDLYERSRSEAFGDEVKRRIMMGTYALSAGYYDAYYLKAQKVRHLIKDDFTTAFEQVDLIMGPTTPNVAFGLGELVDDPVTMYLGDLYTIAVNLAGLPAMSIPAGFCNKLPVGLQIIGNYFKESRMLNAAHQYQQVTDWHSQRPTQFEGAE